MMSGKQSSTGMRRIWYQVKRVVNFNFFFDVCTASYLQIVQRVINQSNIFELTRLIPLAWKFN
jgi:hypothetical protein